MSQGPDIRVWWKNKFTSYHFVILYWIFLSFCHSQFGDRLDFFQVEERHEGLLRLLWVGLFRLSFHNRLYWHEIRVVLKFVQRNAILKLLTDYCSINYELFLIQFHLTNEFQCRTRCPAGHMHSIQYENLNYYIITILVLYNNLLGRASKFANHVPGKMYLFRNPFHAL